MVGLNGTDCGVPTQWGDASGTWNDDDGSYRFSLSLSGGDATFGGVNLETEATASVFGAGAYEQPVNAFYVFLKGANAQQLQLNAYNTVFTAAAGEYRWWYFNSAQDVSLWTSQQPFTATLTTTGVYGSADEAPVFEVYAGRVATETVPEPASLLLLGTGLIGVVGVARRRSRA